MIKKFTSAAMATILIFMFAGIGYAQSEPGITPDNVFYGLDVFFDDVSLALTFDAQAKAQKAIQIADERLLEVKAMAEKSDIAAAARAEAEYEKELKVAGEASSRITKSSGESELEGKIAIEKNAEEHEMRADAITEELKLKIELSGQSPEVKEKLAGIVNSVEDSATEAKLRISDEKEKVKSRIMEETGKSAAVVETESRLIEERTGVSSIKKEKAEEALRSASEEIGSAVSMFREIYGFDATEADIASAITSSSMTVPDDVKPVIADSVKKLPPTERGVPAIEVEQDDISQIIASSGGGSSASAPSMGGPAVAADVKEAVSGSNEAKSAAVLINQAMKHYAAAKSAFGETDYGEAYGQATASKNLAENAIKIMGKEESSAKEIGFETFLKGSSGPDEQGNFVINDADKFNELWSRWFADKQAAAVDFSKYTVVAVFAGAKPTGGYTIEIKKITELEDEVVVSIIATAPGPGDIVTQATTSPYHIVLAEKFTKEAKFEFSSAGTPDISAFSKLKIKTEADDGKTRVIIRKGDAKWDFWVDSVDDSIVIQKISAITGLSVDEIRAAIVFAASGSAGGSGTGTPRTTDSEKYCSSNGDCACGVKVGTDECFYGNKQFVSSSEQCPDFCTGISGNLRIACVEHQCKQVSLEIESNSNGDDRNSAGTGAP